MAALAHAHRFRAVSDWLPIWGQGVRGTGDSVDDLGWPGARVYARVPLLDLAVADACRHIVAIEDLNATFSPPNSLDEVEFESALARTG